jgi:hypothetical protein
MSLWVDSQATRPKPEPNEVTLSLVNSVSSRRAQKDAPKLMSRPSGEAFRASRTSISLWVQLFWGEVAGQAPSAYWPCVVPGWRRWCSRVRRKRQHSPKRRC